MKHATAQLVAVALFWSGCTTDGGGGSGGSSSSGAGASSSAAQTGSSSSLATTSSVDGASSSAGSSSGGNSGSGTAENCPLDAPRRTIIEQSADGWLRNTAAVAIHSREQEAANAIRVVGIPSNFQNFAFLIGPCTEAMTYDPYCSGGGISPGGEPGGDTFLNGRDQCSRLGCEAAGIYLSDVWLTIQPHTGIDDRHEFPYDSSEPAGSVVYTQNPRMRWRADLTTQDSARVSSDIAFDGTLTVTAGETIDISHTGSLRGSRDLNGDHDDIRVEVTLIFPGLSKSSEEVRVEAAVDVNGDATGTVKEGATVIANFSGNSMSETGLVPSWVCGP